MTAFLVYLLKTTVCLAIFYLFFKVFLSNDTLFRFNRKILLFGTIVCFVLPLIKISISEPSVVQTPFLLLEESLSTEEIKSKTTKNIYGSISVIFNSIEKEATSHKNMVSCLLALFITGFIISLIILGKSFFSMNKILSHTERIYYKGCKLIISNLDISPFSWHNYVVISKNDFDKHPDEIITHEMAHIRNNHSIDIFIFELFTLLQWFNPVIRLLKKELKNIHEYQADSSVLESGINATKYQLLLVEKVVSNEHNVLANRFSQSKIKKRISMMLREKSKSHTKWKLVILAPLLCFVIFMFANPHYYEPQEEPSFPYGMPSIQDESLRVIIKASPIVDPDTKDGQNVSDNIRDDSDEPFLNNPVTIALFSKEKSYNITLKFDAYENDEKVNEQLSKIDLNNISTVDVGVPNDATMDLILRIRKLLIDSSKNRRIFFIHY
jgi:Antirepressor regulating drug resistance, predicted signal transduction N-terminal membrane component